MRASSPTHVKSSRRAIVVLGMHRSGTSIATRCVAELGASLPKSLMQSDEDNPDGYWESTALMSYHDRVLADLSRRWDTVTPTPHDWWCNTEADAWTAELADLIVSEFGDVPLFVVKDPRICLLFP